MLDMKNISITIQELMLVGSLNPDEKDFNLKMSVIEIKRWIDSCNTDETKFNGICEVFSKLENKKI